MTKNIIPEAALEQHVAVLGKTGSGKTSTAKLCIEQVVARGSRVCVLDPIKSDWWGMTSSADGKKPGLPFHILGGPRGHVPLHASAGKAIAEIVASGALPLSIIDMADFEPGGQQRFFVDFAPALLRKMRGVVYLVVEEAHLFAPKERSGLDKENMSIHWAKTLATAGRSKGIRLILLSQRVQALHNALLGSCETLIAHRLSAPADQDPVLKWLKANASAGILEMVSAQLSSLKTGAGWVCSGEAKIFQRFDFPRIHTYDNTATPTGDGDVQDVMQAPVDAEKLKAIVGEAVKEAEANDPKLLRAEIAKLKREVGHPQMDRDALVQAEQRGYTRGREEGFDAGKRGALGGMQPVVDRLATLASGITETIEGFQADVRRLAAAHPPVERRPIPAPDQRRAAPMRQPSGPGAALPKAERLVLTALAQYPQGRSKVQVGVLTGYAHSGGGFNNAIGALRSAGRIEGSTDRLTITQPGLDALGAFDPLPSGRALLDYWLAQLGKAERKALEALAGAYPRSLSKSQVANFAGYEADGGGFNNALGKLRSLELITGRGELRASEELFDE